MTGRANRHLARTHEEPACPHHSGSNDCAAWGCWRWRSLWHAACSPHVLAGTTAPTALAVPDATETPLMVATALTGYSTHRRSRLDQRGRSRNECAARACSIDLLIRESTLCFPSNRYRLARSCWRAGSSTTPRSMHLNSAMRIDQDRVSGWIEFHIERTGDRTLAGWCLRDCRQRWHE